MSAYSRAKGAVGERQVASLANECGFPRARRSGQMQQGAGTEIDDDVTGIPLLAPEVRWRKSPRVAVWWDEIRTRIRPGFIRCLFWRTNGMDWAVNLDAREFLAVLRELHDYREGVRVAPGYIRAEKEDECG